MWCLELICGQYVWRILLLKRFFIVGLETLPLKPSNIGLIKLHLLNYWYPTEMGWFLRYLWNWGDVQCCNQPLPETVITISRSQSTKNVFWNRGLFSWKPKMDVHHECCMWAKAPTLLFQISFKPWSIQCVITLRYHCFLKVK